MPQPTQSLPGKEPAGAAEPRRLSVFQRRLAGLTASLSGRVSIIAPKPKPDGKKPTTPDLTARAVRTRNRKQEAVEAYLRVHKTLGRKG